MEGLIEGVKFYLMNPELFNDELFHRLESLGYVGDGNSRLWKFRGFFINFFVKLIWLFWKPYKKYPYRYVWKNTPDRAQRFHQHCRAVNMGMGKVSMLVKFENGDLVGGL